MKNNTTHIQKEMHKALERQEKSDKINRSNSLKARLHLLSVSARRETNKKIVKTLMSVYI